MTQEERELLLKDLSGRLPYGVKVLDSSHKNYGVSKLINIGVDSSMLIDNGINDIQYYPIIDETKPYLRPMLSMTDEEVKEYHNLCYEEEREEFKFGEWTERIYYHDTIDSIDYLNSIHIDYRGLIQMGLAIEVTKENNPYKE